MYNDWATSDTTRTSCSSIAAKRGYREVARIDGYAKGFYLALMKKAL